MQTVKGDVIAKVLMLTDRRIQQLAKEGVLIKEARGSYPLIPNVQAYIKYWQDRATGSGIESGSDFHTESTRVKKLTADKLELEVDVLRGDLVPSDQVVEMLETVISNARAKLLNLPIKAAQVALAAKDLKEIEREIKELVYEALSELSDGNFEHTEKVSNSLEATTTLNG